MLTAAFHILEHLLLGEAFFIYRKPGFDHQIHQNTGGLRTNCLLKACLGIFCPYWASSWCANPWKFAGRAFCVHAFLAGSAIKVRPGNPWDFPLTSILRCFFPLRMGLSHFHSVITRGCTVWNNCWPLVDGFHAGFTGKNVTWSQQFRIRGCFRYGRTSGKNIKWSIRMNEIWDVAIATTWIVDEEWRKGNHQRFGCSQNDRVTRGNREKTDILKQAKGNGFAIQLHYQSRSRRFNKSH